MWRSYPCRQRPRPHDQEQGQPVRCWIQTKDLTLKTLQLVKEERNTKHMSNTRSLLTTEAVSTVLEWVMVTVASLCMSSIDTGMPTMLERPSTTARFPAISTP